MSKQNIYSAMGNLAYAVAKADGIIQNEEKEVIRNTAQEILFTEEISNDFIDKMFETLEEKNISAADAYNYALDVLEANRNDYDFYTSTKNKCILFLESIADSFQGSSAQELEIINQLKKDLERY